MAICEKCKKEIPEDIGYCIFCENEDEIQGDVPKEDDTSKEDNITDEQNDEINKELDEIFGGMDLTSQNENDIDDSKPVEEEKKDNKKRKKKKSKKSKNAMLKHSSSPDDSKKQSEDSENKNSQNDNQDISIDELDIEKKEDVVDDIKEISKEDDLDDIEESSKEDGLKDIEDLDLIRELEEIEDIDERNKKNKNKLLKKLFGNVEDEKRDKKIELANEKSKKIKEEKNKEKEKLKAQKEKEKEKKTAEKEANNEIKKKQIEVDKKKKIEEKAKKKREREEYYEKEEKGYINKLGSFILFFFFSMAVIIVFGSAKVRNYNNVIADAKSLYKEKNYEAAYEKISFVELTEQDDKEMYEKLRMIQYLNKELSYYNSYIIIEKYPEALNALLEAINIYQKRIVEATELDVNSQYDEIYSQVQQCLNDKFSLTLEEAEEIATIIDKQQYSEKIKEICDDI